MLILSFLIWGGIILAPGIIVGIYRVFKHVLGYSKRRQHYKPDKPVEKPDSELIAPVLLRIGMYCYLIFLLTGRFEIGVIPFVAGVTFILVVAHSSAGKKLGEKFFSWIKTDWMRWDMGGGIITSLLAGGLLSIGGANLYYQATSSVATGLLVFLGGILMSIIAGIIVGGIAISVQLLNQTLAKVTFFAMNYVVIPSQFSTIICQNCLRYTLPMQSQYKYGIRYCEHCREEVEQTKNPGKVIFTFGDVSVQREGRVFIRSNPTFGDSQPESKGTLFLPSAVDLDQKPQPVDVSEVHIDTATCYPRYVERFITFLAEYPPKDGIESVRIYYRGALEKLGENLKNALQNTFHQIEQMD